MIKDWVRLGRERGASDLHLEAGTPLVMRIRGELVAGSEPVSPERLLQELQTLLGAEGWAEFRQRRSADLSQTLSGTRCRINAYQTVRGVGLAIRLLSSFKNTLRDCNLHPDIRKFAEAKTGLVLISGATGSGKSTTLAALIEEINSTQKRQIITIESPIEYLFQNQQSFIRQREVQSHTPSFEQAIVDSMREDPDVLVIGEMRTPDVMRLTLNAAETGHLVLATMHSATCAEALSRICMSFPAEIQNSIRAQLADCLVGVICQRLTYSTAVQLRLPQCEIMVGNHAAKATLRGGQFSQIGSVIQTGGEDGMWSFDRYQRWMEQKRDWRQPVQATPLVEDRGHAAELKLGPIATVAKAVPPPTKVAGKVARTTSETPVIAASDEGRIEIAGADDDLEELARQIAQKDSEE